VDWSGHFFVTIPLDGFGPGETRASDATTGPDALIHDEWANRSGGCAIGRREPQVLDALNVLDEF